MASYLDRLFNLAGKTAIVTGAAGQLGGEYVRSLLSAGARVAAFDIDPDNPKGHLTDIGSDAFMRVAVDIRSRSSIENGLAQVVGKLGNPSILVNNAALDAPPHAGKMNTGPFETYPEESLTAMMDVNVKGMVFCCQVIGGHMAVYGGGSIINISSIYGILSPDQRIYEYRESLFVKPVAYSVTKAAVLNLTRYLATYWAKKGVRVNTMTLGGVFNGQDRTFVANYNNKVPLERMANQSDYNGGLLFLASDASGYMTGANLVMDGGYSSW